MDRVLERTRYTGPQLSGRGGEGISELNMGGSLSNFRKEENLWKGLRRPTAPVGERHTRMGK